MPSGLKRKEKGRSRDQGNNAKLAKPKTGLCTGGLGIKGLHCGGLKSGRADTRFGT